MVFRFVDFAANPNFRNSRSANRLKKTAIVFIEAGEEPAKTIWQPQAL